MKKINPSGYKSLSRNELNKLLGGNVDPSSFPVSCEVDCNGGGSITCTGVTCVGNQGGQSCFGTQQSPDGSTGYIEWQHCPAMP